MRSNRRITNKMHRTCCARRWFWSLYFLSFRNHQLTDESAIVD